MKIGVIGVGSIGLRHARNLRDLGQDTIAYDPALEDDWKRQDHLRTLGVEIATDCEGLFKRINAVVSASPSGQHINDLRKAEAYGVPAFIEKPIAMSVTGELHGIISRAENDGLPIMVGYNLRFHQCVIRAKEWIDKGMIGNHVWAAFCCAQFNMKPTYLRDGVIRNWSHEIDLALYLLGPAKVACASVGPKPGARFNEDIADIVLQHESGARSIIHLDYRTAPQIRGFCIVGTKSHIHADLVARHISLVGEKSGSLQAKDSFDENYISEIEAFLRRAERKPAFGATGRDGLNALQICDDARKLAGLK